MVGVAGFEPTAPSRRIYRLRRRPDPDPREQRVVKTRCRALAVRLPGNVVEMPTVSARRWISTLGLWRRPAMLKTRWRRFTSKGHNARRLLPARIGHACQGDGAHGDRVAHVFQFNRMEIAAQWGSRLRSFGAISTRTGLTGRAQARLHPGCPTPVGTKVKRHAGLDPTSPSQDD